MTRKDPQSLFQGTDFVVEKVLYEAPFLSMAPSVYEDATHRKWAVRMPASQPRILDFADVRACDVVEDAGDQPVPADGKGWTRFVANPMRAGRGIGRKGKVMCTSLVVAVAIHGADAILQLPFLMTPTEKDSTVYAEVRREAEALRDEFRAMITAAGGKS